MNELVAGKITDQDESEIEADFNALLSDAAPTPTKAKVTAPTPTPAPTTAPAQEAEALDAALPDAPSHALDADVDIFADLPDAPTHALETESKAQPELVAE